MAARFTLALVTGASSGIGQALARLIAQKGISLLLLGRNRENLEQLSQELQPFVSVEILAADLLRPEERAQAIDLIHRKVPDLIINNAGMGLYGPALAYATSQQLDILQLDGAAVLEIALEAARTLISRGKQGTILNVSSIAAVPIMPYMAVYSGAKAFVNQFSEAFDDEVRPFGVRVLAACPGVVHTPFQQRAGSQQERPSLSMEVNVAAREIWKQVESGQRLRFFDWRYRLNVFFMRYILPKKWVAYIVKRSILARGCKTEIKKVPHA